MAKCKCFLNDGPQIRTGSISFVWKIKHILCEDEIMRWTNFQSETFICCGAEWSLRVNPRAWYNYYGKPRHIIGFYLEKNSSEDHPYEVFSKIGFEDKQNRYILISEMKTNFVGKGSQSYYKDLLRNDLEQNRTEWMPEETLSVFFELKAACDSSQLKVFRDRAVSTDPVESPVVVTGNDILSNDLEALLKSPKHSDVTLEVGGAKFPAHKSILSARSPVFAAMFEHNMTENLAHVVTISDIHSSDARDFLLYIYTGSVVELPTDRALALYSAADKYDLKELKAQCVEVLLQNLSVDNVCDVTVLADAHNDGELADAAKNFVCKNASTVLSTQRWNDILREKTYLASDVLKAVASEFSAKSE